MIDQPIFDAQMHNIISKLKPMKPCDPAQYFWHIETGWLQIPALT